MDRLWAPWRAQYIRDSAQKLESDAPRGCFLCRGIAEKNDKENLIVWRRGRSAVFLNKFPYNNGHLLVAPLCHVGALQELEQVELLEPIETIQIVLKALDRILRPEGYNIGLNLGKQAGAGLPGHLHWHVVPRWDGDTNFMPILGNAKVIVESLGEFHERMTAAIAELESSIHPSS
jgi:ATP adenylyltransferase